MRDLKVCTVCLSTTGKLRNMDSDNLRNDYNLLSGLRTNKNNGLPSYLCVECLAYTRKSKAFREKCQRAYFTLQEIMKRKKEITLSSLQALDTKTIGVARNIGQMDISNVHWEQMYCQWDIVTNTIKSQSIVIAHHSTFDNQIDFSLPMITKNEEANTNLASPRLKERKYSSDECVNEPDNNYEEDGEKVTVYKNPDGLEKYMILQPLSVSEARASMEIVNTLRSPGQFRCEHCFKGYYGEDKLTKHVQIMHTKSSGLQCGVCGLSFSTSSLLQRHSAARHARRQCRACGDLSYDRASAKQHLLLCKKSSYPDPASLAQKSARTKAAQVATKKKKESDFDSVMATSLIAPLEMYALVERRKLGRNYTGSRYRCELCYRGFTCSGTYDNHMKKHDERAGALQCDVCRVRAASQRSMYKHMISTHTHKYACRQCDFQCFNRSQAYQHYRFHLNYIYKCPHCPQEFKKSSTHLTHIRIKHPSTRVCDICGHSFVSLAGMRYHRVRAHSKEEIAASEAAVVDRQCARYCAVCDTQFLTDEAHDMHLGSSSNHADKNL